MKISIVMPLFNAEKHVGSAIESVIGQSHDNWELLVVDDGSTDRSSTIVNDYASRDHRIRMQKHPGGVNRGVSRSRRLGFVEARGEWIALLDADDLFTPDKLSSQSTAALQNPECVVIHGGGRCIDADGNVIAGPSLIDSFNQFAESSRVYRLREQPGFLLQNFVLNSSSMVRRSAIGKIDYGFDQLFQYEDWTLWIALSAFGPFLVQAEDLVRYRVHESSATHRVQMNPLREVYSHIEFLMSVLAAQPDPLIRTHASEVLRNKLNQAIKLYQPPRQAKEDVELEFDIEISARKVEAASSNKKRHWLRKLIGRAALL